MKASLVPLALASLAVAAPASNGKRAVTAWYDDITGTLMSSLMSMATSVMPSQTGTATTAQAKIRAGAKRSIIRYGPFTLPANKNAAAPPADGHSHGGGGMAGMDMGGAKKADKPADGGALGLLATFSGQKPMDPNGIGIVKRLQGGFCKHCTVLSGKTDVVFGNGTRADISSGVYLHHIIAIDVTKAVPVSFKGCGGVASSVAPFLGGAVDGFTQYYTTPDGKFASGYYLKDDALIMQAELVNYRTEDQQVYIQMDVEYMDGKYGNDAAQYTLAATECSNSQQAFKPPPNSVGAIKSQVYPFTKSGSLIALRGHMHDGGTYVSMMINDKMACESKAEYGGSGNAMKGEDGKEWQTIKKMGTCDGPINIKAGDNVVINAGYDTKAHPLRKSHGEEQENMGIMTFVFVPSA